MSERFRELAAIPMDDIMVANAAWLAFQQKHSDAIDTTIGVLIDPETDKPWQPQAIIDARYEALVRINSAHEYGYQKQAGNAVFLEELGKVVFGAELHERNKASIIGFQSLGGTDALSLARDTLVAFLRPGSDGNIPFVFDAGWPNHPAIFGEPFKIATYDHLHPKTGAYNHQRALGVFASESDDPVFLLQACGYNDDGTDRTQQQWDEILDVAVEKDATVILDAAYLGLANGLTADRYPIEQCIKRELLTFVCVSTSKNMGLYNERVGALFIANAEQLVGIEQTKNLNQLIARIVRRTISSPPLLAAKAAGIALADPEYYTELEQARQRLETNRQVFASIVADRLPNVGSGKGLFTKLLSGGFSSEQQSLLHAEGILTLPNSRINLGGMRRNQVERVGSVVIRALQLP